MFTLTHPPTLLLNNARFAALFASRQRGTNTADAANKVIANSLTIPKHTKK